MPHRRSSAAVVSGGRRTGQSNTCWADQSIGARNGLETRLGDPASVLTEYSDFGIGLSPTNNDRKAGYLRLCELLCVDPNRLRPSWGPLDAQPMLRPAHSAQSCSLSAGTRALMRFAALPGYAGRPRRMGRVCALGGLDTAVGGGWASRVVRLLVR
jgi:hypothetical protein